MTETPAPKLASRPAMYRGGRPYSFRSGESAEIIGVRMVERAAGFVPAHFRPCFVLLYSDGMIDFSPIESTGDYVLHV